GRAAQLVAVAAAQALSDAFERPQDNRPQDHGTTGPQVRGQGSVVSSFGVCLGTTMGEPQFVENMNPLWDDEAAVTPLCTEVVANPPSVLSERVASYFQLCGPNLTIPTACAAGNYALGWAFEQVQSGAADMMLAGGTDAFSRLAFVGFSRLHAFSPDVCRPFDRNRQGLLLSEGAGVLVLERLEHAQARGARIYAEMLGYGLSADAHHITAPHPDGAGAALAMRRALQRAQRSPDDVDYINAHGTGTPHNDKAETLAIKSLFGERAYQIPVSSIKALTGHAMGAASAIEAIACVLSLYHGILPPTWNYQEPDPECDLDYIPNAPRDVQPHVVLNNSYGFGGNNACVVFGKW
ncbi:MAG: beta-ketoacyl-[acyl-carrier-protein] synthase family protein, partial [Abditibacteriales bacterium]|nr:beta-ketoacyl-[acyl-carrier-protein] synthase family protein [Abditibacteriales bacterium]MDW8368444.1 beta-ketoacyl-[acyl-carrier-protein] synthase family protein [Abditibacteriales bacterium]